MSERLIEERVEKFSAALLKKMQRVQAGQFTLNITAFGSFEVVGSSVKR
ncbi:hypothetical protein [Seinonella peptonophila]|nr:hypothetical protein [Seinonella peptonophila]